MIADIIAGLMGALVGAVLIAAVLYVAFRLLGMEVPRLANLWKAAFLASAAVIVADGVGSALIPGDLGALVILVVALTGAFFAYDTVLKTPDGEPMGRRAAAVALGAHAVFSLGMFLIVFPMVMAVLV